MHVLTRSIEIVNRGIESREVVYPSATIVNFYMYLAVSFSMTETMHEFQLRKHPQY